jgi:hypothetical protein
VPSGELPEALRSLVQRWRETVASPRRRAIAAELCLAFVGMTFIARAGTPRMRMAAGVFYLLNIVAVLVHGAWERRLFRSAPRTIRRLAGDIEPERAARALRALSLLDAATLARSGTSTELSTLHVARTLAALPRRRIERAAERVARRLAIVAFVFAAATLAVAAFEPFRILEGADVLVAREGTAPLPLGWLDDVEVELRPPAYLHRELSRVLPSEPIFTPYGTLLTVRGEPLHKDRHLFLSDSVREVPFVDDGTGHSVARWPVDATVALRVVARFGEVIIPSAESLEVTSIEDRAPQVTLEGAPQRISLASETEVREIPIHYTATDDHGLREVHLVLRSGVREERRVLARLDGDTRYDRGGYTLRTRDAFVKSSHVPVEIVVEAKDNDPLTGPKWGTSAPITLVPPDVGEPEALRRDALLKLRDHLVDSLATRLDTKGAPPDATARASYLTAAQTLFASDDHALDAAATGSYAGVRLPGRLQAMLKGQLRKLHEAVDKEKRVPNVDTHAALVKASERLVLVVDALAQGLGQRDTKQTASQLAEVADDLATGAAHAAATGAAGGAGAARSTAAGADAGSDPLSAEARTRSEHARAVQRMDASVQVLTGGARSLLRLGALGRDIGEIVTADLARVARARKESDALHTELAARDLAARLHQPDPSFGSRGRPGHAGGEAGGGGQESSEGDDEGEAGDAERAFQAAAEELEQLAQEHASEVSKVDQTVSESESDDDVKALSEEAKKHAEAVRDATRDLPTIGAGSDSWTSRGAGAREHADEMAHALEQGRPADAVGSGRSALNALEDAQRLAARSRWQSMSDPSGEAAEKRIDEARKKLEPEVRWAEQALEQLKKKEAQRAAGRLQEHASEEEKLAGRAREVEQHGREQGLPEPALQALHAGGESAGDAARALRDRDVEKAREAQREAQRQLELARQALNDPESDAQEGDDGNTMQTQGADIPNADAHKGPEDFRRRVVEGLGQSAGGRQKDAVRRYAEGLLR